MTESPFPSLELPDVKLGPFARPRKQASVEEAIGLPGGTQVAPTFHRLYQSGPYEVGVQKPGKEAAPDFPRPNPNDMLPTVRHDAAVVEYVPGFTQIFEQLQSLAVGRNNLGLELVGCLLYRAAYMLDHQEVQPGIWRYYPPEEVSLEIERWAPDVGGLPIRIFLQLIDVLAWQEDTKYRTLGYDIGKGYGRTNNLSTCAHVVAVFLDRASLVGFAGGLARPPAGINPLTQKAAREYFPLLAGRASMVPSDSPPK